MIEHVFCRAKNVSSVDEVIMAVCEEKLLEACKRFRAKTLMTSRDNQTALDRVAEAARIMGYIGHNDIVINLQGDEPVMPPPVIEITRNMIANNPDIQCANLVEKIVDLTDLDNHHRIKAIISKNNRLIYLTRQPVPASIFDINKRAKYYRQTCVMAFRGDYLQYFTGLERTPLELIEGIDMLRLIENDQPVASGVSPYSTLPVDTPDDIPKVIERFKKDEWLRNGY